MHNAKLPNIFIGIDGGATKTIARIEDENGNFLGEGKSGTSNIRLSVENTWKSIQDALDRALLPTGIPLNARAGNFFCCAGLAGTQVPSACEKFLAQPHPFRKLILESDGYISCVGAHGGKNGAVIAIGTGVVAYQIEDGQISRVSGWGFPQGDEGSGAWLGLEAVRATLHWQDGRRENSPLIEAILAHFQQDWTQFIVWANQAKSTQFAELAPIVVEQANQETPLAVELMLQAAREIDRIGEALAAKTNQPLPCALLGGLASFLEPWLGENLRSRLVPPQYEAAKGAILRLRQDV
jgi:glucosamine kinase